MSARFPSLSASLTHPTLAQPAKRVVTKYIDPMQIEAFRPHGAAILAFHRGADDAVVVAYDDMGDRDEIPVSYFFRPESQFAPYERRALELCRGCVLDVGAGSGCHSLWLQDRGFEVCAIDIDPDIADVLRERGVRDARCSTIADLRGERFDTILMLMNGLGLAETLAGLAPLLNHLRTLLAPGGQVLADSTDVRIAYGSHADATGNRERADGRYMGEITFQLEFEGEKGPPFPQLYVDPETLVEHAGQAGWSVEIVLRENDGGYLSRLTLV
jgi:SAM-dependent methyltransferase